MEVNSQPHTLTTLPWGKSPSQPMNRRLNFLALPRLKPWFLSPYANRAILVPYPVEVNIYKKTETLATHHVLGNNQYYLFIKEQISFEVIHPTVFLLN